MDVRVIQAPSAGTLAILRARCGAKWPEGFRPAAVGLVQGKFIDMVVASDIAEKCANVTVSDVRGTCPQHMVMLAIAGDTAEVLECLEKIRKGE